MKFILLLLIFTSASLFAQNNIVWEEEIMVTMGENGNLHPRISLDADENPVVIWGNSDQNVHFSRWDGTMFTPEITLNDAGIFAASWAGPDLVSFGDTVYVVFKENPEDIARIYLVRSFDGGQSFSEPLVVDGMLGDHLSRFPSVTVNDEGQPIVSFMKLDSDFGNARYVVVTSDDFGITFGMDVLASDFSGGDVCDCCPVGVVAENNYVATLYRDNLANLRNSWAGISTNGGDMFMNGIQIDQTNWVINACPSSGPDGVIIGDSLYSVFMSAGEGDERIYFSVSSLTSLTDQPDQRLTQDFFGLSLQNYPRIANYGNAVAMVWKQTVGTGSQIPVLFTDDITEGLPVDYDTIAGLETYGLENADVAVSSNAVHVVWQDNVSDHVMYRKGTYVDPVGVNETIQNLQIYIYPNPASNFFHINMNYAILTKIEVCNLSGSNLIMQEIGNNESTKVDISGLKNGIYFVRATDSHGKNHISKLSIMR